MAKIIRYQYLYCEVNLGTEEQPVIDQIFLPKSIECKNQTEFDAKYPIAAGEAVGEITVEGEYEPEEPTDAERIAELEEALSMLLSEVTE